MSHLQDGPTVHALVRGATTVSFRVYPSGEVHLSLDVLDAGGQAVRFSDVSVSPERAPTRASARALYKALLAQGYQKA